MNITVNFNPSEFGCAYVNEIMGGYTINIALYPDIIDIIKWAKNYKEQLQKEADARANNSSIAECYHEYQTMLNLVGD